MSQIMDEEIKRWTARRKSALVLVIIQGKTKVAQASRQFDLTPSEIESWVEDAKRGMENALRAKPEDVREQYERQLKDLQVAYGEAMLELRARKKLASLLGKARFWQTYRNHTLYAEKIKVLNRLLDGREHIFEEGISASQYQFITKVSKATATRHLSELLEKNLVVRLPGRSRSTRYKKILTV